MKRRKKKRKSIFKKKPLYGIVFVATIFSITFIYFSQHSPTNQTTSQAFQFKAAIVDHLSLTQPNQTFTQTATNILKTAGYTVNYHLGEEVNVEFYRNLPKHDYSLIVLRVHSGLMHLFTSERYKLSKYIYEQLNKHLGRVALSEEELEKGIAYFGMTPLFVKDSMKGRFKNTTIIMMGCYGLTYTTMADAFIEKGAKVYISWNGSVSMAHTDQATTKLLQHLISEKQTIKQAVTETMKEIGPDPIVGSILQYYPETVIDNYVIPNITSNLILNDATISG